MWGASSDEALKSIDAETTGLDAQCSVSLSEPQQRAYDPASIHASHRLQPPKNLWNRDPPICELPNEILAEIFKLVEEPDKVAQICQHWRRLAIGMPALWTRPPTGSRSHELALCYLERSKNSLLNVHISEETNFATTSAILEHFGRIRSLHVNAYREDGSLFDIQEVIVQIPCDALHLEDLSIKENHRLTPVVGGNHDNGPFEFSLDHFKITPKLRKLELARVYFHWPNLVHLPALTHLSLYEIDSLNNVTGAEFANTLRAIPLLQSLAVSFGDIRLKEYSAATHFQPIHLLHLTTLEIQFQSDRDHIDHFLAHVTMPCLRTLKIDHGYNPVDYSSSLRTLASTIHNGDFLPLTCLTITPYMFEITDLLISNGDSPYIVIWLPIRSGNFGMTEQILSCITPVDSKELSSLVQVTIRSLNLTSDELHRLFGSLPRLEHVEFSRGLASSFFEALKIPVDHSSDNPIPFAKLNSMHCNGYGFYDPPHPNLELHHALLDCLMQRCEYGAPIQNLVLHDCHLVDDFPLEARLKEIVVNVNVTTGEPGSESESDTT